jgi:hypothetical protein
MNKTNKLTLLRKFTILFVLLAGFVVASSDATMTSTLARPCCSSCEAQDEYCASLPEPQSSQCFNDNFNRCWRWCSFSC